MEVVSWNWSLSEATCATFLTLPPAPDKNRWKSIQNYRFVCVHRHSPRNFSQHKC